MSGRHFLQVPGPTNVPERVRQAMDRAVIDHRGPALPSVTAEVVEGMRTLFGTGAAEIAIFPGSGTAAWEASLANTLNPGDRVLGFDFGQFSHMYCECARGLGMDVEELPAEWGRGVPIEILSEALAADTARTIKSVLVVHNETSTGVTSSIAAVRRALDHADHPALLFVDAVSSLASIEFQFDAWSVDVALTGSQKGLMLPPGMAVLAVSRRAVNASQSATTPRYFLDWAPVLHNIRQGYFPYTPATLLLYGLREALRMLHEEGLDAVYARHARHAEAVRAAVVAWELELLCKEPIERSNTASAVLVPDEIDADDVLRAAEGLQLSLGTGLSQLKGRVFRIGHLGSLGELEVLATLAGTELALN
ncbi:MAG TPA: aminotransferase class V-fold PLP-dependent enzyme, partial [Solirubrobacteraceae bacterium]|nr:aminotransferase class V-fold PLP-dependent enzyme [Solirubrobacteraceae bacterium]